MNVSVSNLLGMARSAEAAGNHEEALTYYNRVLEVDSTNSDAWLGKGRSAGWQSTLAHMRLGEVFVSFNHAVATADVSARDAILTQAVEDANRIIVALYSIARKHMLEYVALKTTWAEYIQRLGKLIDALEQVRTWRPGDRTTLENVVHLCKDGIEGVAYRDSYDRNLPKSWTLTPQYEASLRGRMQAASETLRSLDPGYSSPVVEKKKADACFVATATLDDPDHPTVHLLRTFRDKHLAPYSWGRRFISIYYSLGPTFAGWLSRSHLLRRLSLFLVISPLATLARSLERN